MLIGGNSSESRTPTNSNCDVVLIKESTSDTVFEELQVLNGNTQLEAIYDGFQNFVNYLSSVRKINSHTIRQYAKLLRPYFNYRLSLRIHNEDLNENVKFPKPMRE